jgi:hypothetical protein
MLLNSKHMNVTLMNIFHKLISCVVDKFYKNIVKTLLSKNKSTVVPIYISRKT